MERTLGPVAAPQRAGPRQDIREPGLPIGQEARENLVAFFRILTEWASAAGESESRAAAGLPQSQVLQ
jgi:hypothetical protein